MTCSVEDCDRGVYGRGFCSMHWKRWYRYGDPSVVKSKTPPKQKCQVEDCDRWRHAYGYCISHFKRWQRHGDPLAGGTFRTHNHSEDWFKTQIVTSEGCWLWTGFLDPQGYGRIRENGVTILAHRLSYERHVAPIPEGLTIDHLCHTRNKECPGGKSCLHRRCINPEHLEPVTNLENVIRGRDRLK